MKAINRKIIHSNAIRFPITKDAGVATLSSVAFSDFEAGVPGDFEVEISCLDASKLTNNLTIQPYVSYDQGSSWLKAATAYTDLVSTGNTAAVAEVVTSVLTGATVAAYEGKYFILYNGTTPYLVWADHTGSATKPDVTGFEDCAEIAVDISGAADTVDAVGAIFASTINATAQFNATYTAGTDTLLITLAAAGACSNASSGNLLVATAVASSFATTTQGKDGYVGKCVYKKVLSCAPRAKVTAIFDATGALAAGHGCKVNVVLKETEKEEYRKDVKANVLAVPDVVPAGFTYTSAAVRVTTFLADLKKVYVAAYCADASKITDTAKYILQSSNDGMAWWNASAEKTDLANGTGVIHAISSVVDGDTYALGKYVRIKFYSTDATGALASGHAIQFNLVLAY